MPDDLKPLCRVEILRINGDIYINGEKKVFAADFNRSSTVEYDEVDWILGWAKIGLMSKGHTVPHFPAGKKEDMNPKERRDTSVLPASETAPK